MDPEWDRLLVVGRIARPHGLRGHVVIDAETDFPGERFAEGARVFVAPGGRPRGLTIEAVRFHRGRPIVRLTGVESVEEAEALGRGEVRAPEKRRDERPDGLFYHHELEGCRVVQTDGTVVGDVRRVERTGAADLLVVDAGGRDVLVPFVPEICVEVDADRRAIVVALPEGLLDLSA